jgi:hypothetical protein
MGVYSLLSNLKFIGITILSSVLFFSLFQWNGAKLTNEILILCGMIFISSLFSELENFKFWGMEANRIKLNNQEIQGEVINKNIPLNKTQSENSKNTPIQLMSNDKGNFLALAFEIERLLKMTLALTTTEKVDTKLTQNQIVEELFKIGIVTEVGKKQVSFIREVRNKFVHGKFLELDELDLNLGLKIAESFYKEIYNYLSS